MAGRSALTRRTVTALAVCLGVALAGHLLVLSWWEGPSGSAGPTLQRVPDPVFTRLLAPSEPPPPQASPPPPPAARASPGTLAAATPVHESPLPPSVVPPAPPAPAAAAASAAASAATSAATSAEPAPAPSAASVPAPAPAVAADPAQAASAATSSASAPLTVANDDWPPDARLTYKLEGRWRSGPLYGSARVQWQRQGTNYQAQVEVDIPPFVHRALTSQGEVAPRGLLPRVYEERSRTRRRAMRMEDAQITLADGSTVPRPADVQDTASQFVELGHRFATGRQALALGEVVTVWLARPGGVDLWTYDVVAQDRVGIPQLGEVMAWRLRPRPMPQRRDNISAEIWFAPSLRYLPVRIRLALGDEAEIDLKVETVEQR